MTLYDSNQGPHGIRDDVAKAFGLQPERVRVISPYVGGGFGSKGFTHPHVILTAMAAQASPAGPVKLHADAAADVRAGRLPHADDPAHAARRRRATAR